MADPVFPKSTRAERESTVREEIAKTEREEPPRKPPVEVTRADAPMVELDVKDGEKPKPKFTKEEIMALATVTGHETTQNRLKKAGKRSAVIAIPTGILSTVAQSLIGWWAAILVILFALYWAARPLFKQSRDGWT